LKDLRLKQEERTLGATMMMYEEEEAEIESDIEFAEE